MEKGIAEITATAIVKSVQNYVKLYDEEITNHDMYIGITWFKFLFRLFEQRIVG